MGRIQEGGAGANAALRNRQSGICESACVWWNETKNDATLTEKRERERGKRACGTTVKA